MATPAKVRKRQGIVTDVLVKKILKRAVYVHTTRHITDRDDEAINKICFMLFAKDYICDILVNVFGTLCSHYPESIVVPLVRRSDRPSGFVENHLQLVADSIRARRKSRFPVPVIIYEGKYICRSAACHETAASVCREYERRDLEQWPDVETYSMNTAVATYLLESLQFLKERQTDAEILRHLNVGYICDFRLRNFGDAFSELVNSSEEVYMQFYEEFKTALLPYPTVDFFKHFNKDTFVEELTFDWTQRHVAITLQLPADDDLEIPEINFRRYKVWKVLKLTKNYLLYLLSCITSGRKGILIHCLAGEDRTPLFISLLRLSLWADGLIHRSLTPLEITFLTLAYDWYLFGHNLPHRLEKKWQIMRFCFCCLRYITSSQFSKRPQSSEEEISNSPESSSAATGSYESSSTSPAATGSYESSSTTTTTSSSSESSSSDSTIYSSERERKLTQVRDLFLMYYDPRAVDKWRTLGEIIDDDFEESDSDIDGFTFRELVDDYQTSADTDSLKFQEYF